MLDDLEGRLLAALGAPGRPSSDFDLNAGAGRPEGRALRDAGVLVAVEDGGEPRVWLTRRSAALKHHPGQVAFPGGKVEPGETVEGAALREACEEIGLEAARVLGMLEPHETVTGFSVTPVVALVEPFEPVPEVGEVAEVFSVPLAHVADPSNYLIRSRRWRGAERFYYAIPWGPHYVWGATARMLRQLADRL